MWITYDNQSLQDGVGAQTQRILSIYWIAKLNGWNYHHSPIICNRDNLSPMTLERFNRLIALPNTVTDGDGGDWGEIVRVENIYGQWVESVDGKGIGGLWGKVPPMYKITFAHTYIDTHPDILSQPFPHTFDWIQKSIGQPVIVALHIRRGDVTSTQNRNLMLV